MGILYLERLSLYYIETGLISQMTQRLGHRCRINVDLIVFVIWDEVRISVSIHAPRLWLSCYIGYCDTLEPRQHGRHFPDNIFKCIFKNENVWISVKISLEFIPTGPINNIPAMVQIMALRRLGNKPLSEPIMVSLLTHICVTRPRWVNETWLYLSFHRYG